VTRLAGRRAVRALLDSLLDAKGIGPRALFLTQQQGKELPPAPGGRFPVESLSGYALEHGGAVWRFWLDHDGAGHVLRPFHRVDAADVADSPEYAAARRRLARVS
jgi:hypothetical protein